MDKNLSSKSHQFASQGIGRPTAILKGPMLSIVSAISSRMVQAQRPGRRMSVPKAIELIDWILGWMSKNPQHYGLNLDEIQDARKPSASYLRRLFQHHDELIKLLDDQTRFLSRHVEALLPVKPSSAHALWQMDGQFLTGEKSTRYLKKVGYTGHRISGFVTKEGGIEKSVYILRAVDAATSFQLGVTILTHRANQLDVARFFLALFLRWGLPLELRIDLAGEHFAKGISKIISDRLDVGIQKKSSKSARLNGSIEVHHRVHSVLIAQVAMQGKSRFLTTINGKIYIALVSFKAASQKASDIYAGRRMHASNKSPQALLDELPSVVRIHHADSEFNRMFFFEWNLSTDRRTASLRFGDLVIQDSILKYHPKVAVRLYPSYAGDRLEIRSLYSKILLICKQI